MKATDYIRKHKYKEQISTYTYVYTYTYTFTSMCAYVVVHLPVLYEVGAFCELLSDRPPTRVVQGALLLHAHRGLDKKKTAGHFVKAQKPETKFHLKHISNIPISI